MFGFFCKKIFTLIFSLWSVITLTFFLMHLIPGDPFIGERVLPQEVLDALYRHFGLDKPLFTQYLCYLKGLFKGDLGPSIVYPGRAVTQFIKEGFPLSAIIGLQSLFISIPCGISLGLWASMKRGKWQDTLAMIISTLGISVPSFIIAPLLQYLFAIKLHLLPVARWGGFEHTILPSIALALLPIAFIARLVRSNMVEVLQQDYILLAKAKGLSPFYIAIFHGLRNAIPLVVSYIGPVISGVITGSFIIEKIFAIPGLGQWMILSIQARDYPMIMGLTIFFSALLMSIMFFVDLIYGIIDPRVRRVGKIYV